MNPVDVDHLGALRPLRQLLVELTSLGEGLGDRAERLERLMIETPLELTVLAVDGEESLVLETAPPTQRIETSFMPVLHSLQVRIEPRERDDVDE